MIYGLYLSAGGLQVNEYRQDLLANNIANAGTTGFKRQLSIVSERMTEARENGPPSAQHQLFDRLTGGSGVRPTYTDFAQGSLEITDNPLDVAIVGEGFLRVIADGAERYTRDGRLTIDATGRLMTSGGHLVPGENGKPITIDLRNPTAPRIGSDGTVTQGDARLGRIGLVAFRDPAALTPSGKNLYQAHGQAPQPADVSLRVGAIEASNVDPVAAMVDMMQVTRTYELNATMISLQDGMLGRTVNDLGRIG